MTWDHNKLWSWHPSVKTGDDRTFGERAADRMKRVLATWTALIAMIAYILGWAVWQRNTGFDPYPWILLNLSLSAFAGLQCFVLLIANKRGEQIAANIAENTYNNTQTLKTLLEQNTQLTEQVATLTKQMHAHLNPEPPKEEKPVEEEKPVKRTRRTRRTSEAQHNAK